MNPRTCEGIQGYLYILFNESYKHYGDSTYKFGRTQNLRNRIFTYNTSFIHDSKYLYTSRQFLDSSEAERVLFFLMKEYRIKKNKEFFNISLEKGIEFIDKVSKLSDENIKRINSMIMKNGLPHHITKLLENNELETNEEWYVNVFKPENDIKEYLNKFKYSPS